VSSRPAYIPEDTFWDEFLPIQKPPDGEVLWEYEDVADAQPRHVWTVVEGENDIWFAAPGFHFVNKVGYVLTEKPWDDPGLDAIYHVIDDPNA